MAKVDNIYLDNGDLTNGRSQLQDLSRNLNKMWGKYDEDNCQAATDHLFKLAANRMESEHDKKVLVGLRQMMREVEMSFYQTQRKYQDAFFFPNLKNI